MVKNRNIGTFILLNIVTCGIYSIITFCAMGEEIERVCEGDGRKQMQYIFAWLLGMVTLGIYPVVWFYSAMNRLQDNAYRYGDNVRPQYSGSSFLLWWYLGAFIGVGPIIAMCNFISDLNAYSGAAGRVRPLAYTSNLNERQRLINIAKNGGNPNPPVPPVQQRPVNNGHPGAGMRQGAPVPPGPAVAVGRNVPMRGNVDSVPPTAPAPGTYQGNRSGKVTCVAGNHVGTSFPIRDNESFIIGTDPSKCSIVIDAASHYVSRTHCTVKYSVAGDTYVVIDHSTNGTYTLGGQRIAKDTPRSMNIGDSIYLGDKNNIFRFG